MGFYARTILPFIMDKATNTSAHSSSSMSLKRRSHSVRSP